MNNPALNSCDYSGEPANYETENFSLLTDPKLACTCSDQRCHKPRLRFFVLEQLQKIRDDIGGVLLINSGGRCRYHPDEIHRDKPADHQKGIGVDVSAGSSMMRGRIIAAAINHGFNAIGVYPWGVHLAIRSYGRQEGELLIWPGK